MKIFKYWLKPSTDSLWIKMPDGAVPFHVHDQNRFPVLWARVDPQRLLIEREFYVVGTGWELDGMLPPTAVYLGSAHCGEFVWHVYDTGRARAIESEPT